MRKFLFIFIFLFNIILQTFATHNRAGEITYRHISELTYEITIVTYCYTISAADRGSLEIDWGDNTSSVIYRVEKVSLPDNYVKNTYVGLHTYSGTGIFQIVMIDFNRNQGVVNIPGSVNVPFALRTILQINPMQGFGVNNTPILLNEPIDKAAINEIFIHNPSAYDPDGDSLSYELTTCLGANGEEIENYSLPENFLLFQNYPNPFNPFTTIKYQIPEYSYVTLKVYDVLGKEISTLVNEEVVVGSYEVEFDGSELTSGIYFYKLQAGNFVETRKMVLLK